MSTSSSGVHRALLLALASAVAAPAQAQTVRGTILDSESGQPVSLAYVGLLAEGQELVVAALADVAGGFELEAPGAGAYFLYVTRTGYETVMDGVFELGADGVLDLRIGLEPEPVTIDPVTVEAARDVSPLEEAGFYERAARGIGHFMIREEIERVAIERVSDAFHRIPSIGVVETRPLVGGPSVMQTPALVVRRGADSCSPTLYVDRAMVAAGVLEPVRPDEFVSTTDIEAIEVYARTAEVPAEFDAINDCGVVLIWTRMR